MEQDGFYKVIIIGDYNVGKSALLNRLCNDKFSEAYTVTVGVEYGSKEIDVDGELVQLQIWDSAGQDKFRSLVRVFFVGVVAVFLTYAVNNKESFENLDLWLQEAKEKANEGAIIILVGNKSDMDREVSYEEGMEYMKQNKLDVFFETSAKNGENVTKEAARRIIQKEKLTKKTGKKGGAAGSKAKDSNFELPNLNYGSEKKSKGCCGGS